MSTRFDPIGLVLLSEGEPIIPFKKNIHNKPFNVTINIKGDKSAEEIACIVKEALKGRGTI